MNRRIFWLLLALVLWPVSNAAEKELRIAAIVGENEYLTWETLPEFALKELKPLGVQVDWVMASTNQGDPHFTNFDAIARADLVIVSVRRRAAPDAMMKLLRAHLEAEKPLVGIRTASHAWAPASAPTGNSRWPEFDGEILGGDYQNHYNNTGTGQGTMVSRAATTNAQFILQKWPEGPVRFISHLYKNPHVKPTVTVLLRGKLEGTEEVQPVAWINEAAGRRVFYTSLGSPEDFKEPAFRELLRRGILWAAKREELSSPK